MALGTRRQSSVVGVLVAACASQLLQHAVPTVGAEAVSGKALSQDYLTLRYHGQDPERFKLASNNYPTEVCSTAPATCMDLRLWECADSSSDMHVAYTAEAQLGVFASERSNDPPHESAGGSRLLLARSVLSSGGPMELMASHPELVLWSGCNASCADCAAGTGHFLILQRLPKCIATAPGGILGILYNDNFGQSDTHQNCWASLDAYDREAEKQTKVQLILKYCAFGSVAVVLCALVTLLICVQCHLKRMREQRRLGLLVSAGRSTMPGPRAIGKATIEEHFPVSHSHEGNQCVVCLLNVEEHEACRKLQCRHEFHADCIVGWWMHEPRASLECPICKRKQRLGEEDPEEACEAPDVSNNNGPREHSEVERISSEMPARSPAASGTAIADPERGRNRPDEVEEAIFI